MLRDQRDPCKLRLWLKLPDRLGEKTLAQLSYNSIVFRLEIYPCPRQKCGLRTAEYGDITSIKQSEKEHE